MPKPPPKDGSLYEDKFGKFHFGIFHISENEENTICYGVVAHPRNVTNTRESAERFRYAVQETMGKLLHLSEGQLKSYIQSLTFDNSVRMMATFTFVVPNEQAKTPGFFSTLSSLAVQKYNQLEAAARDRQQG